ncbi:hypothetical protein EWM64_g4415 [Hericium alpestre]|uniref:FAD-binding PCMH-type domain-containing protein n=1 Tax=Hericium alpestre TaxID=135208 RepID=A0A4Y9ZZU5_9AGAM|nr:hypothetical protein EWM64_g4415 [Hericium alpestre]
MTSMASLDLKGQVLVPGSSEYDAALHRNSDLSVLEPGYIVQPEAYTDIPPLLAYAAVRDLEVAVKSGGCHSQTWASSQGGVVIDLSRLNRITVSDDKASVSIQGGANWGDVYEAGAKEGVEVPGTSLWIVGVGGSLTGGANGNLSSRYGLGSDNLLEATVVLADGRIVRTNTEEEPDLFWAIRGGGNQFGIVVEFVVRAYPPSGPMTVGRLVYPGTAFDDVLKAAQEFEAAATPDDKVTMSFMRTGPDFKPTVIVLPWISSKSSRSVQEILKPFRTTALPIVDYTTTLPDQLATSHVFDATLSQAPRRLTIRGATFTKLWTDMVAEAWRRWVTFTEENPDSRSTAMMWDIRPAGRIAEFAVGETAYPLREPHSFVAIQGRNTRRENDKTTYALVKDIADYIRQANTAHAGHDLGVLLSMAQGDEPPEAVFGPNLPRLRKLKAKYDPKNVWKKGFAIEPDFS